MQTYYDLVQEMKARCHSSLGFAQAFKATGLAYIEPGTLEYIQGAEMSVIKMLELIEEYESNIVR